MLVEAGGGRSQGFPGGLAKVEGVFAKVVRSPFQAVLLSLLTLPLLLLMKTPVADTPLAFYPVPRVAAYYGVFFTVGWLLDRQAHLLESLRRWRWISLGGVLLLTSPILVLIDHLSRESGGLTVGGPGPALVTLRLLYGVYSWLLVFGVTGFFLHHFNGESRAARYVADSAYWQYIMHLPLVLFLQWKLAAVAMPGFVKLTMILMVAVGALLLTYQLFVRHTIIGRVLNGPRERTGTR